MSFALSEGSAHVPQREPTLPDVLILEAGMGTGDLGCVEPGRVRAGNTKGETESGRALRKGKTAARHHNF